MKKIKNIITWFILITLSFNSYANDSISLNDLALPSEVKDLKKNPGSIYYSPTSKGKPLVPVHFWGEVQKSGLHYVPVNTTLISGISLAGGLTSTADLESVKVTTKNGKVLESKDFDLTTGGTKEAYEHKLKPGDTIFIKKTRFYENRAYYTSLIGVLATLLSSYAILNQVKK
ncbi:SLBB domain-containing protein [Halobacteriovorax sp. HLS]|uniref:SLBB domain-containing protein n=1 Tax=Halobacteriovorax sp. HLS TaxID=2234000 RepID=UPI000FD77F25|nr:SLBB domain-containing protein [Halobacteriovorax sp. HLS]